VFQGFRAEVGGDCGFEPVGFVQLVGRGYADQLRRNVAMQQRIGIKTELVSPEDLPRLLPGVTMDDVGGAAWEPESGYADPNATAFASATMRGGWAGMIMMSPDGRPIIDRIRSIDGLYVMLGDSGTSFKTSPAIGRCLAEWIVEGRSHTVDLTPFRATRFAEGQPWIDEANYGRERLTISR